MSTVLQICSANNLPALIAPAIQNISQMINKIGCVKRYSIGDVPEAEATEGRILSVCRLVTHWKGATYNKQ